MAENKKIDKYKKEYVNLKDNERFLIVKDYKPTKSIKRTFDSKTETYKYEVVEINHKLDWENSIELIEENLKKRKESK